MSVEFVAQDFWNTPLVEFDESEFLPLNEGNFLIAFLQSNELMEIPNPPTGWEQLPVSPVDAVGSGFVQILWCYYKILGPAETGIYNFDPGIEDPGGWFANFVEYSGVDSALPVNDSSAKHSGNDEPILVLPTVTVDHVGSRLLIGTANQAETEGLGIVPTVEGWNDRGDGPVFIFDKAATVGESGDIDVVSGWEFPENKGWDLGFLIALNPTIAAGQRFDCSTIDSQIN